MKYKVMEKLGDFFRSRLFTKTNISIIAALSIVLNIAIGGMAYSEHKEYQALSAEYAGQVSEETSTKPAEETSAQRVTSPTATTESQSQTQGSRQEQTAQPDITETKPSESEASESEQGTYYRTDSGTKYHVGSCSYLRSSRNAISLSQAKAQGLTPCSRCIK